MTDRPILFSGPMIRALLEGRKTQTRRILKPQPPADMGLVGVYAPELTAVFGYVTPDADFKVPLRYMPGDRLWVREAFCTYGMTEIFSGRRETDIAYRAGRLVQVPPQGEWSSLDDWPTRIEEYDFLPSDQKWKPGIHMPRSASRLTLIVTDVRVQRLQEISPEDADDEGTGYIDQYGIDHCAGGHLSYSISAFHDLWDSLNVKRPGCSWVDNPWVVALTFDVIKQNIDAIERAAA